MNDFREQNQQARNNLYGAQLGSAGMSAGYNQFTQFGKEPRTVGNVTYYPGVEQCSEEWFALRCGILTASTMKHVITPAQLKRAKNAKASAHLYEIVAQRIAGYIDASDYMSDDMERGYIDEQEGRDLYAKTYAPVETCGFIVNDKWGFTIGYSPDGLVGDEGQLECKGRRHKFQIETIISGDMPDDFLIQVQTGLLVSERAWCDFISYSAGLPMATIRIYPDEKVQKAIEDVAGEIEAEAVKALEQYAERLADANLRLLPTKRRAPEQEIIVSSDPHYSGGPLGLTLEDLTL